MLWPELYDIKSLCTKKFNTVLIIIISWNWSKNIKHVFRQIYVFDVNTIHIIESNK